MKVYVVMSNDYPDSVFSNEKDAKRYCKKMDKESRLGKKFQRVYWRPYEFEIDKQVPAK